MWFICVHQGTCICIFLNTVCWIFTDSLWNSFKIITKWYHLFCIKILEIEKKNEKYTQDPLGGPFFYTGWTPLEQRWTLNVNINDPPRTFHGVDLINYTTPCHWTRLHRQTDILERDRRTRWSQYCIYPQISVI